MQNRKNSKVTRLSSFERLKKRKAPWGAEHPSCAVRKAFKHAMYSG